ncbi:DNA-binding MarR family transcriptional regulator [Stackebrandtia endophytica]|uniref:DNA-binding MarR family transcriptional regulator n=1 Tax=Stackebrandtia endophytica TaxID=1496996 RepID=A0A543B1Y7_9ACTN|nr:MarR family transcriptional regulator [Stackebrandtia endophytica]TQL78849.1 DNA-binding MarR family transcriptional regulator [Stackebrandtia endophytica]
MSLPRPPILDDTLQGWRVFFALHARVEDRLERALQAEHELSRSEFSVLEVLAEWAPQHLRMQALAGQVVLSQSATTRLVTRLERRGLLDRHLCQEDRRGIYAEITEAGHIALASAVPTYRGALQDALIEASADDRFASMVSALASVTPSR